MVDVKSIQIMQKSFLGIHVHLPHHPLYLIMSTKTILAPDMLDIAYFDKQKKPVAVVLTADNHSFEALLSAPVVAMNKIAEQKGVCIQMKGKEALMLCEEGRK